jgi:sugar phosphate isomerase/epimerase
MSAEKLLDEAIRLNANVLQLCDNLPLKKLDWENLAARSREAKVEIQIGTIGGGPELEEAAEIGRIVGSSLIRLVIGPSYVTQGLQEVADSLKDGARRCQDSGARLAIENHDFFTTAQIADLAQKVGFGTGVCVDTANSISNLEGTQSLISNFGDLAICLHAKDVIVEREIHLFGFRIFGVPAGKGFVDFPSLKNGLPNLQTVILEQWTPTRNGQPPLEAEVADAEAGLAYLRSVWS